MLINSYLQSINAITNNLYYTMKTTNFIRIAFRIIMQSLIPMFLLQLIVIIFFETVNTDAYIVILTIILGSFITIFGIWFHFISEHRFKNRRPKGLYREYINWFIDKEI